VVEADLLLAQDYLARARGIARAYAAGRAAGRAEFVSCEVAAALCIDDRSAQDLIAEARMLTELPGLAEAIAQGRLRLPHTKAVIDELLAVDTAVAVEVLTVVLGKVDGRTPAQLRGVVRRAVIRVDADAASRRRRAAARERRVFVSPERDGMALFGAHLRAPDAMEAYRIVDEHAAGLAGDDRCADERRADALMQILRGGSGSDGQDSGGHRATRRQADIVVPVSVALGWADEPCDVPGYGPLDPEAARELLTDATLRKVCVDAKTGQVLAVENTTHTPTGPDQLRKVLHDMITHATPYDDTVTDAYTPTEAMRRTVIRRDKTCTFPACTAPAHRCDLDHRVPWPRGRTEPAGLDALSRKHHRAKQAGWTPTPMPDGTTWWTSPSGRVYIRPNPHEPPDPPDPSRIES